MSRRRASVDMEDLEYAAVARDVVERIGRVGEGTEVVFVTDPLKVEIARALATVARGAGATATVVMKPRLDGHGAELPAAVEGAMLEADVVFDANTHAITHTDARRRASEAGVEFVIMRGVTEEIMLDQLDSDYDEIRRVTRAVAAVQSAASTARLTGPQGTDLSVDISGREGHAVTDELGSGDLVALPVGKSAVAPVEGSAAGTVVVDSSIDGIGVLERPVTLTVEDGVVYDVEGGQQARDLERRMDRVGDCARNIAEAPSLGTNPDVVLCGNQAADKKKRGTAHVAIGDNVSLGGDVPCDLHFDMTLSAPTVVFDEELVAVEEGRFRTDAVLEHAAGLDESLASGAD